MSNLSEVKRKPIYVNLRGKEFEVMYSLEAFSAMEEQYGSVETALKTLESNKIKDIKFFVHQGLIHMDNPPTEVEVAKMIDVRELKYVIGKVMQALSADAPVSPDHTSSPNH